MQTFFHGWRRKAGIVTLVMACVFMGGWIRSRVVRDEFSIRQNSGITQHLISNRSRFAWRTVTIDDPSSYRLTINLHFTKPAKEDDFFRGSRVQWKWHWQYLGFEFGHYVPDGPTWTEGIGIVPYWSFVFPLTLLSAYLILWKPRKRVTKAVDSLS